MMRPIMLFSLLFMILQLNTRPARGEERIEIQRMRDYHRKTFLNPDGSYTTEISAGFLHYEDARGDFQEINRQFQPARNPQHRYEIWDGLYRVCIEKIEQNELVFSFQPQGGPAIRCSLLGLVFYNQSANRHLIWRKVRKVTPLVNGNKLRLENIFPGISLQYTYTDLKFKEEIFLSQSARTALPSPGSLGLGNQNIYVGFLTKVEMDSALEVLVEGQKIRQPAPGLVSKLAWNHEGPQLVSFENLTGKAYFHFPVDFAVNEAFQDSAAQANHSQQMIRKFFSTADGDFILSLVPLNWLRSQPTGTVVFDPQISLGSQNNDTWIEYNSSASFHTSTVIRVGRGSTFNWKRGLLKFNFSPNSLPQNAKINSATCKLYWYTSWKVANGTYVDRPIFLHQLLKEWNESQVDWYEARTGTNWSSNGVGFNNLDARNESEDMLVWGISGYPRWMEYNITQLVQRWRDGSSPNYGMILWAANEDDYSNADEKWIYSSNYSDASKHPKLVINYTLDDLVEYTYTPSATVDSVYFGKDLIKGNYDYTIRDWVNRIAYRDINNGQPFTVDYSYDLTGNILSQQYTNLSESDLVSYSYDPVYQLKTTNSVVHDDQEFTYDANGNIVSKKINSVTTSYLYRLAHPNQLQQVGSRNFSYDGNGNILGDGRLDLEYDYKNQLLSVGGPAAEQYLYDNGGLRVKKKEGVSSSGTGYNVTEWVLQLSSAVNGVVPTGGRSMYRIRVNTAAGSGDHYTNEKIVIADGLNIPVTTGSYLEYDIRAGQSSSMRVSVQFYYFNPATNQYAYSWDLNYTDQNGVSNYWKTDLNSRYVNQWYHRVLPLTSLQGKIIKKVFFMTNDDPNITGPQTYIFYGDEIKIDGQDLGRANGNAAAPTVFYENFDDGNIHDGIPVDWFTTGSYWTVSSGNLYWSNWSSSSSGQCSHPDLTYDDFEVQFELKADGRYADNYWAGFAFRKDHPSDWYNQSGFLLYYRYNGEICLYKPSGIIASVQTGKILANFHSVKISAQGSTIKVYVDGNLYLNITDDTYRSGYFGLNVLGVGARFDNLKISGIPVENEIYYVRGGEGNVIAEYDGLGNLVAEYVYGNNQRLAKINSDKTIDYYLNDHLGSARSMVSSGWSANYYPFGEIASQTGSPEDTRFDYTGQERDRETGLMYFGARYYDPGIGRWMSMDPSAESDLSLSHYSFCSNNPINKFDPDGLTDWWAATKAVSRSGLGITESVGGILTIIGSLTTEPVTLGAASLGVLGGSALFSYGGTEVGHGILDFKVAIETPEGLKADEYKTIIEIVSEKFGADEKTQKALQLIKDLISLTGGAKKIVFNDTFYNFLRTTLVANGTANDLMELIEANNEIEDEAEKENNNNCTNSNNKTNDQK